MSRRRRRDVERRRTCVHPRRDAAKKPAEDRRFLFVRLRPMSIADMKPGVPYEPGISILEVGTFATPHAFGTALHIPLDLPPELREPTDLNARVALALICAEDPHTKAIVDEMKATARFYRESENYTQELCGGFWLPPSQETMR